MYLLWNPGPSPRGPFKSSAKVWGACPGCIPVFLLSSACWDRLQYPIPSSSSD
uniref:Uncharacterized protein n=1 Tax=Anguilla anguilla TaxID=7936 RepID=A0A0E9P5N2_ANGAN